MTILLNNMRNPGDDDLYRSTFNEDAHIRIRSDNSDLSENAAILLISAPGFRQDSLLAILSIVPGSPVILCADTVAEAEELLSPEKIMLVIIDHTLDREQMRRAIPIIRGLDQRTWILLLVAHPRDTFSLEEPLPNMVLCDGFSSMDLLDEIKKTRINYPHIPTGQ